MRRQREAGAWSRAQQVAAHALAGFVMPSVGNATHFHVAGVDPGWGPHLLRVAQIGLHVFYRFGGYAGAPGSFSAQPERSAPGSEMAIRPVYASLTQTGGVTADGRQTAQYILADATILTDAGPKTAAPTATPAPGAASAVSANSAGKDSVAVVAATHPSAPPAHVEAAPKPKADAAPKADPKAEVAKLTTTTAS